MSSAKVAAICPCGEGDALIVKLWRLQLRTDYNFHIKAYVIVVRRQIPNTPHTKLSVPTLSAYHSHSQYDSCE